MELDQDRLNSATKYPSIETYHTLDPKTGKLSEPAMPFTGTVILTEKVDGTNGRIITLPDGDWFIGSREEILYARGDRVKNPMMGIVPALLQLATRLGDARAEIQHYAMDESGEWIQEGDTSVHVWFLEVYGHSIGPSAKQYTTAPGVTGYRLFDLAIIPMDVLDWERSQIASWRQHGGQKFLAEDALQRMSLVDRVPLTPRLGVMHAMELPTGLEEMKDFLFKHATSTRVALDASGRGEAEGIVLRSEDRSVIAKARFQDYDRTLKINPKGKGQRAGH